MIDQIIQLDTDVFLYLNSLGTKTWDPFWMAYTAKFNWIPFYALLLYLMLKQMQLKAVLISLVTIALMVLFTDQVTNLFKDGFQRLRPCHMAELIDEMRIVRAGCGGRYGFFSGHASNTMSVAIFIGMTLKKRFKYLIYLMVFWALLMGYSRIYVGVHYPLDVLLGALFGLLSGTLFYKLNRYVIHRFKADQKPAKKI